MKSTGELEGEAIEITLKLLGDVKDSFAYWAEHQTKNWSCGNTIEGLGYPNLLRHQDGLQWGFHHCTAKRDEILANCQSEDECERTAELIRPILRGRDIKRYGYNWANLWLINTHNGIRGKLERIHIEEYPAVKAHLDQYWDKISKRADKGETPYNLRNCAYLRIFISQKWCGKS